MNKSLKLFIALYLFGVVVTYGHAWANVEPMGGDGPDRALNRLFMTVLASTLWPLYISTIIYEKNKI